MACGPHFSYRRTKPCVASHDVVTETLIMYSPFRISSLRLAILIVLSLHFICFFQSRRRVLTGFRHFTLLNPALSAEILLVGLL